MDTEPVEHPVTPPDAPDPGRFAAAIAAIDSANAQDPNQLTHGGATLPKELFHAQLMTAWVQRLDPAASEAAHLAARAHHFRRWTRPRSDFPDGRAGYLRWRTAAKKAHADEVAALLVEHGYDAATVERVGRIVRKEGLGRDHEVQVNEDARCLVFLTTQLDAVTDQLGDDHMVEVLRRTLPKMSAEGVAAAAALDLGPRGRAVLAAAVAAPAAAQDGPAAAQDGPAAAQDGPVAAQDGPSPTLGGPSRPEGAP